MAEYSRFFDSTQQDERLYGADEFAEYFRQFVGNGVFLGGDKLIVATDQVGLKTYVKPGNAWINGYFYKNTENLFVTHESPHASLGRLDRVVLRLDLSLRTINIAVIVGTPATTPQPPEITRDNNIFELALAQVAVTPGSTNITPRRILDERQDEEVCGIVSHINQVVHVDQFLAHVDDKDNPHLVTKEQVGLGNILNSKQATKTEFDAHRLNFGNPHAVTKRQVGLGDVQNYGIATAAEASAGTDNNKYMTPLRTMDVVDEKAGGSISGTDAILGVGGTTKYARQINVSNMCSARGLCSQVNASKQSRAEGECSQVNASYSSDTVGLYSQVNASYNSDAQSLCSQVNASKQSRAEGECSQVNASFNVINYEPYAVAGGYNADRLPSPANLTWRIYSKPRVVDDSAVWATMQGAKSYRVEEDFTDYGEYFESADGQKIPAGHIVTLEGDKIRKAQEGDRPLGVISKTAGIILGGAGFCWQGRYLRDEFGGIITHEIPDPNWEPKDGETESDRPLITVEKENPEYDREREYLGRAERDEWHVVGLLGQCYVRVSEDVKAGDCIVAGDDGIGEKSDDGWQVMKITSSYTKDRGCAIARVLVK